MPTAILKTSEKRRSGNPKDVSTTATITHSNKRLYTANGRTYEYTGDDASGNRIYRDTQPRG